MNIQKYLFSVALFFTLGVGVVGAWSGLIASPGDVITSTKWNEMINKILPVYSTGGLTGKVGIGDSTPDHKLDVAGNIGLNTSSYINFGDIDGSTGYGFRDNAGTIQFKNSAGLWTNIPLTGGGGNDDLGNHTAIQNIALDTFYLSGDGDDEGIQIDTNGNVGIGTVAPNHLFSVAGNIGVGTGSYLNFGAIDGTTGYGLRDNAGTIQFKNNAGSWTNIPSSGGVSSVFGRSGAVTAVSGDYTATQITNTPAGGIAATNVQTAINELDTEKQATITGGATTITSSNLTINRALLSDASGKVGVSTVTNTELGYLSGVTSAIQTQISAKANTASPTFTGNPTAPTPLTADNDTSIATTAFVKAQGYSTTSGIGTLNTLTAATQTFQVGTTGTDFNISSATSTHTFNIPDASATARGLMTTGAQIFAGNKTFNGNAIFNGAVTIGDAGADTLSINANTASIPNNLNFDTNTLFINSSSNRVGIGTNNPSNILTLGSTSGQSNALISARMSGSEQNSFEWGHSNTAGYGNTLGQWSGGGQSFLAFNSEGGTNPNTFRTRGIVGRILLSNNDGSLLIGRAANANADNQTFTEDVRISTTGGVGIGVGGIPSAILHLRAGTATANTAPLKFTSGTNLTTAEAGAMEYNGTQLFFSPSTTRNILAQVSGATAFTTGSIPFATTNGYLLQDNANFFWDDTSNELGIGTNTPNTKFDINGDISLRLGTDYATSGTTNNVILGGGTSSTVRYTGAANGTVTGITGGQNGKILNIMNASSFLFTLANESTSSTTTNRIITGNGQNVTLSPGQSTVLQYDSTATRWRLLDGAPKRYVYRVTSAQTNAGTTTNYTTITGFTTGTLPIGAYKFELVTKFRSNNTASGMGLTLSNGTATTSNFNARFEAQIAANGSTAFYHATVGAAGTTIASTAVPSTTIDYYSELRGTFQVTIAGTMNAQFRSEVSPRTTTIQPGSYMIIEPLY